MGILTKFARAKKKKWERYKKEQNKLELDSKDQGNGHEEGRRRQGYGQRDHEEAFEERIRVDER